MRNVLIALSLVFLLSCSEDAPVEPEVVDTSATDSSTLPLCYSDSIAELVGQPAAALEAHPDRPAEVRLIGPGTLVTQEYLPNRLNVHLNKDGRIVRLDCG